MQFNNVTVVGAGFMGSGIAQVCAQTGCSVTLIDVDDDRLGKAQYMIAWSLGKLAEKGRIAEGAEAVYARIQTSTSLDAARNSDLVIEAVFEDLDVKISTFKRLDAICGPETIFGSNTSTIPITTLSAATKRPEKFVGIHFFGPVPLMKLVEIIPNPKTAPGVVEDILAFTKLLGKNPVLVRKDIPGFIMNRIFGAMEIEAVRLVEAGVGTVADIDQGMCDGFNLRVGPLMIADAAGLDVVLNACRVMHKLDPVHMLPPPALLERLVSEGKLGSKSGEGFYRWAGPTKPLGPAF